MMPDTAVGRPVRRPRIGVTGLAAEPTFPMLPVRAPSRVFPWRSVRGRDGRRQRITLRRLACNVITLCALPQIVTVTRIDSRSVIRIAVTALIAVGFGRGRLSDGRAQARPRQEYSKRYDSYEVHDDTRPQETWTGLRVRSTASVVPSAALYVRAP